MWVWESMNPGTTRRHLPSRTTVFGPFQAAISLSDPTATMRPPRTARASASGFAGSPVQIFADSRTRSAAGSGAPAAPRVIAMRQKHRHAVEELPTFFSSSEARAAASRATATRYGEHET